jgi:leucyl/phenylalanyl-tRNA--protein transferase
MAGRTPTVIPPDVLVAAYRGGIFPMAVEDGTIAWFSPDPRGILPIETFQVPTRLARSIRQRPWVIRLDTSFEAVMRACAKRGEEGTWISEEIVQSYVALHRRGQAHSVEVWREGSLVGGLYGVHLGGVFFGESMFHRERDASKAALVALVDRLRHKGFALLDTQWTTPHLEQFGAIEIPRREYLRQLKRALNTDAVFLD